MLRCLLALKKTQLDFSYGLILTEKTNIVNQNIKNSRLILFLFIKVRSFFAKVIAGDVFGVKGPV